MRNAMPTLRWIPLLLAAMLAAAPVSAQVLRAPFDEFYTVADLGRPEGIPGPLGGLTFLPTDPNTIIIGGAANNASGALYALGVVRDASQHVVGFAGAATRWADGEYNDGGVTWGPGGVLFVTQYPINQLAQIRPGETTIAKTTDLSAFGVASSVGAIFFVPPGFPGAGQAKVVSYNAYRWYTLGLAPDGNGTYDVTSATYSVTTTGGPEGFIYVPQGSPLFPQPSMLVTEYQAGMVTAFQIDANGDPRPDTRTVFVDGLSGAEGAVIDPLTGDFLFSTFGGGDRVVAVRGFVAPPSTTTTTTTPTTSTTSSSATTTTSTTTTTSSSTTTTTAPVPCETATTCDDADVCNGVETCRDGFCAPAAAAACRTTGPAIAALSLYRADAVALIDVATRTVQGTVPVGRHPWGVAWAPDGARVWVTERGNDAVTAIDPVARVVVATVPVGTEPLGVAVHPDGTRVYVAVHGDDVVSVIDTASARVLRTIRAGDGPAAIVVNPTGTRLFVGNYRAGTLSVIDTTTETVLATVDVGGFPLGMALSPDGGTLVASDYGGSTVAMVGTVSNTVTADVRVCHRPLGVAFGPDGGRVFVTCVGDDAVAVLDVATRRVVARQTVARLPLGIAIDRATADVWVASSNGDAVAVLDGDTASTQALDGGPVGFGQFVGALPGDCPRQALTCEDVDPFTTDACNASAGCGHAELSGLDAVAAGTAAMAAAVDGVPAAGALAQRVLERIPALAAVVAAAQTGGDATVLRGLRRDVARLAKLIEAAVRRGQMGTGGARLLDLARATRSHLPRTR